MAAIEGRDCAILVVTDGCPWSRRQVGAVVDPSLTGVAVFVVMGQEFMSMSEEDKGRLTTGGKLQQVGPVPHWIAVKGGNPVASTVGARKPPQVKEWYDTELA